MPAGHGLRSRTRDTFSRGFRQKGYINLTTYLRAFRLGDYVDIKVNGAVHKVRRSRRRMAYCLFSAVCGRGAFWIQLGCSTGESAFCQPAAAIGTAAG